MPSKKGFSDFSVVHPHAAGIDIGATFHVVAVSPECDPIPVRQFQSFTTDLHRLSRWLREVGVTSVAMESTGVYWIPVFEILESDGFEVILVNARDVKQVPGGKTRLQRCPVDPEAASVRASEGQFPPERANRRVFGPTCATGNGSSSTRRHTSSTCRKPSCR